jgi:hypothetical protein
MSVFQTLNAIDVNKHVEKKGQFTYLSWAWAVAELRKASPTATWEVIKTDGLPFCKTECGYFVEVSVTVDGITLSQIHPVLDNSNKTIPMPNAFQINTSIQRCLVKAIALHGLGLYIYAGEDLPTTELEPVYEAPKSPAPSLKPPALTDAECNDCINAMIACDDMETLKGIFGGAYKRANDVQKEQLSKIYKTAKAILEGAK